MAAASLEDQKFRFQKETLSKLVKILCHAYCSGNLNFPVLWGKDILDTRPRNMLFSLWENMDWHGLVSLRSITRRLWLWWISGISRAKDKADFHCTFNSWFSPNSHSSCLERKTVLRQVLDTKVKAYFLKVAKVCIYLWAKPGWEASIPPALLVPSRGLYKTVKLAVESFSKALKSFSTRVEQCFG